MSSAFIITESCKSECISPSLILSLCKRYTKPEIFSQITFMVWAQSRVLWPLPWQLFFFLSFKATPCALYTSFLEKQTSEKPKYTDLSVGEDFQSSCQLEKISNLGWSQRLQPREKINTRHIIFFYSGVYFDSHLYYLLEGCQTYTCGSFLSWDLPREKLSWFLCSLVYSTQLCKSPFKS